MKPIHFEGEGAGPLIKVVGGTPNFGAQAKTCTNCAQRGVWSPRVFDGHWFVRDPQTGREKVIVEFHCDNCPAIMREEVAPRDIDLENPGLKPNYSELFYNKFGFPAHVE